MALQKDYLLATGRFELPAVGDRAQYHNIPHNMKHEPADLDYMGIPKSHFLSKLFVRYDLQTVNRLLNTRPSITQLDRLCAGQEAIVSEIFQRDQDGEDARTDKILREQRVADLKEAGSMLESMKYAREARKWMGKQAELRGQEEVAWTGEEVEMAKQATHPDPRLRDLFSSDAEKRMKADEAARAKPSAPPKQKRHGVRKPQHHGMRKSGVKKSATKTTASGVNAGPTAKKSKTGAKTAVGSKQKPAETKQHVHGGDAQRRSSRIQEASRTLSASINPNKSVTILPGRDHSIDQLKVSSRQAADAVQVSDNQIGDSAKPAAQSGRSVVIDKLSPLLKQAGSTKRKRTDGGEETIVEENRPAVQKLKLGVNREQEKHSARQGTTKVGHIIKLKLRNTRVSELNQAQTASTAIQSGAGSPGMPTAENAAELSLLANEINERYVDSDELVMWFNHKNANAGRGMKTHAEFLRLMKQLEASLEET